jgi:serine protease DegS
MRSLLYLAQLTTLGLAIAFLVVVIHPDLLRHTDGIRLAPPATPQAGPFSYADGVAVAAPAVVNINTRKTVTQQRSSLFDDPLFRRFFGDALRAPPDQREESSLGSGVIVSSHGYVLTNHHVIEGADTIRLTLRDGREATARVVGTDPEVDLAVLHIDLKELPSVVIGESGSLQVGDVVLAIGNPFGVGQTVTQGIISATGRNRLGINTFEDFLQTDAAINPGNSGGALVNARGELIGINTAIFSRSGGSQGIGFAIPMSLARFSMEEIIQHGRVRRGWLGIEIQELTPALAESFGLDSTQGIIIAGVLRKGPADLGKIEPGDVITSINGEVVASVQAALLAITRIPPGEQVRLGGLRNGRTMEWRVTVSERPR